MLILFVDFAVKVVMLDVVNKKTNDFLCENKHAGVPQLALGGLMMTSDAENGHSVWYMQKKALNLRKHK